MSVESIARTGRNFSRGLVIAIFAIAALLWSEAAHAAWSGRPSARLVSNNQLENPDTVLASVASYVSPAAASPDVRIRALARALGPDPKAIFNYVQKNIEFEPQYGLHKGAIGAWLDRSAGSLDQAQLFVDIARAANVPARFAFGKISLGSEAAAILRVNDARQACLLLAANGTPGLVNGSADCNAVSGAVTSVTMLHGWAEAQIDGVWYAFDPALKLHTRAAGVDLWSAAGSSGDAFWSQTGQAVVRSGGQVSGLSPSTINGRLVAAATTLQGRLDGSQGGDWYATDTRALIGGWALAPITPILAAIPAYSTGQILRWSGEVPTPLRATLRVQAVDLDYTYDLPTVYGQRLQVEQVGQQESNQTTTRLSIRMCQNSLSWVNCTAAATQTGAGYDRSAVDGRVMRLTINHPYPAQSGAFGDETLVKSIVSKSDLLVFTGGGGQRRIDSYRRMTESYLMHQYIPGVNECSEFEQNVPGSGSCFARMGVGAEFTENGQGVMAPGVYSMDLPHRLMEDAGGDIAAQKDYVGLQWWSDWAALISTVEPLSGARVTNLHAIGFVHTPSEGIDVDSSLSVADAAGQAAPSTVLAAVAALSTSMEAAALRQVVDETTLSQVWTAQTVIGQSAQAGALPLVAAGQALPASYTSLRPQRPVLQSYLDAGFDLVAPSADYVLARKNDGSEIAWLSYAYKGAVPNPLDGLGRDETRRAGRTYAFSGAVDLLSGGLQFSEEPDLVDGAGDFPKSLTFQRFYRSGGPASGGEMGAGWSHSFASSASYVVDYSPYFANGAPAAQAPFLVAVLGALEAGKHNSVEGALVAGVTAEWLKQTVGEVVHLSVGRDTETFYKRMDGIWASNISSGDRLTMVTQTSPYSALPSKFFTRTLADGSVQNFRPLSQAHSGGPTIDSGQWGISDWTFPDGVVVTYVYNGGGTDLERLVEVHNNLGRKIILLHTLPQTWQYCTLAVSDPRNDTPAVQINESECDDLARRAGQTDSVQIAQSGQRVDFTYDGLCPLSDNLCVRLLTSAAAAGKATRTYAYQANGDSVGFGNGYASSITDFILLSKITDTGHSAPIASFVWEAAGNLLSPRVNAYVDAVGRTTTYRVAGDFYGVTVDPIGAAHTTAFDQLGQPVVQTDPLGRASRLDYDGLGRKARQVLPEGNETRWTYDIRSNPTNVVVIAKSGSPLASLSTVTHYVEGETVTAWNCANAKLCNKVLDETDVRGGVTNYAWDTATGLLTQVKAPAPVAGGVRPQVDLAYTTYGSGGALSLLSTKTEKVSDSQNLVTTYSYDSANHYVLKTSTVDPSGQNLRVCYQFDAAGNLIGQTDPRAGACP